MKLTPKKIRYYENLLPMFPPNIIKTTKGGFLFYSGIDEIFSWEFICNRKLKRIIRRGSKRQDFKDKIISNFILYKMLYKSDPVEYYNKLPKYLKQIIKEASHEAKSGIYTCDIGVNSCSSNTRE